MRFIQVLSALAISASGPLGAAEKAARPTPSAATAADVCAAIDLINRSIDQVLAARNLPRPAEPINHERGLRLDHVYQLHLACLEQLHEIEAQRQIGRIPPLAAARPGAATADDVVALSKLMHDELKRPAWILWIVKLPEERASLTDKTADDAFSAALRLYVKMNALADKREVTADEAYAQLTRCVADAKAVLQRLDAAHRYRIDAPTVASGKDTGDAYRQCVAVRGTLQRAWQELSGPATTVPTATFPAQGADVFVQTQVVLAELNRLKLALGVSSSTPLAVRTEGKTWTDAYNQAVMVNYLLAQFGDVRNVATRESLRQ
jgi:hypothetical protein